MIKHTHRATFRKGDYSDGFMFTPADCGTPFEQAAARIAGERGADFAHGIALEVVELPSAADTRARGKLRSNAAGRYYYEI